MKFHAALAVALLAAACSPAEAPVEHWKRCDESAALAANAEHENVRMRYQLIQSKFQDKNELWAPFEKALNAFGENRYAELAPLVLEQDIPTLQGHVANGRMTYEDLTTFYLYRIRKLESDSSTTLHAVVALNPEAIEEARECDRQREEAAHPIHGMPILLKDNINTANMPTTAGAALLADHMPPANAFIVDQLSARGALILGKVNLSEWAYFFCDDCPLGYSAVGGQTLNPYGRGEFETGGSSAGSGVAVAANYAVAAIGTETSGSILSPSSMNSVVGLKPTIGLASRTGIVPISSTLDTLSYDQNRHRQRHCAGRDGRKRTKPMPSLLKRLHNAPSFKPLPRVRSKENDWERSLRCWKAIPSTPQRWRPYVRPAPRSLKSLRQTSASMDSCPF